MTAKHAMGDEFQVILNRARGFVESIPVVPSDVASALEETLKPTHVPLTNVLSAPCPVTLHRVLEEVRAQIENVVASPLPFDGVELMETVRKHAPSLANDARFEDGSGDGPASLVMTEDDAVVGVSWGILSNFEVITLSSTTQRWVAWGDIEAAVIRSERDVNLDVFRRVDAKELSYATPCCRMDPVLPDDGRSFFALPFVCAQIRREKVVHELVVSSSSSSSGFFAVLARDDGDGGGVGGNSYMFPAVSRRGRKGACCKLQDVLANVQEGGYLAFVSYIVLRTLRSDIPDFSFVASAPESKEREAVLRAATNYVRAASRLWSTERILQILRREVSADTKQERVSQELSSLSPADRVFTGGVLTNYATRVSMDLSAHVSKLRERTLRDSVFVVLLAVHSLVLDAQNREATRLLLEQKASPELVHAMHMRGETESAVAYVRQMDASMDALCSSSSSS